MRQEGATAGTRGSAVIEDGRTETPAHTGHVPGEVGLWVFIFGDLIIFGLIFGYYLAVRADATIEFNHASGELDLGIGVVNTGLMLTSSLAAAVAVRGAFAGRVAAARWLFFVAAGCGAVFLVNKAIEWHELLGAGERPAVDSFFMYFFVLTGLHAFHVVLGMIVLLGAENALSPGRVRPGFVEGAAVFWHLVDLLWIILFPLLYLLR